MIVLSPESKRPFKMCDALSARVRPAAWSPRSLAGVDASHASVDIAVARPCFRFVVECMQTAEEPNS